MCQIMRLRFALGARGAAGTEPLSAGGVSDDLLVLVSQGQGPPDLCL